MSVTIPFSSEIEALLRKQAAAEGKDVDTFIREVIEERLAATADAAKTSEQWIAEFEAWMKRVADRQGSLPTGYTADDSRESIYGDRT